jgi:hypothetical protein
MIWTGDEADTAELKVVQVRESKQPGGRHDRLGIRTRVTHPDANHGSLASPGVKIVKLYFLIADDVSKWARVFVADKS